MQTLRSELYLLIFILAGLSALPATAQDTAEDKAPARETPITLTLNKVIGLPGQEVNLPVLLARKSGAPNVVSLRIRVNYPGSVIQFNRVEDAYLSRRVNLQIEGREENADRNLRSLEINFSLPDPQNKEFPSGQIASIYFTVAADAPDQIVHLNPEAWIDGTAIFADHPTAQIVPGEVRVSQTPVFLSCFFFSH
jgi:hypothetical protein